LSGAKAAEAIARGLRRAIPGVQAVPFPLSDGGEGLTETLVAGVGGRVRAVPATGPLGGAVTGFYGLLEGEHSGWAVVEVAATSGLTLVPPDGNHPDTATTRGTGEILRAAMDAGIRNIIVGLGGSATVDGGAGLLQALGARLLDREGRELGPGGLELLRLSELDLSGLHPAVAETRFVAACDVQNPLCGPRGASRVFGPQKGAGPDLVDRLDLALGRWARLLSETTGVDVRDLPGAGAAGGLGGGLAAALGARLRSGVDMVLEMVNLREHLRGCSLVITGEGRLDSQTGFGKVPHGVGRMARLQGIPVIAMVGSLEDHFTCDGTYFDAILPILPQPMTLADALARAETHLTESAMRLGEILRLGLRLGQSSAGVSAGPDRPTEEMRSA